MHVFARPRCLDACSALPVRVPELRTLCRRRWKSKSSFAAGPSSAWPFRSSPSPCPPAARQPPSCRPCLEPFPLTTIDQTMVTPPGLERELEPCLKSRCCRVCTLSRTTANYVDKETDKKACHTNEVTTGPDWKLHFVWVHTCHPTKPPFFPRRTPSARTNQQPEYKSITHSRRYTQRYGRHRAHCVSFRWTKGRECGLVRGLFHISRVPSRAPFVPFTHRQGRLKVRNPFPPPSLPQLTPWLPRSSSTTSAVWAPVMWEAQRWL